MKALPAKWTKHGWTFRTLRHSGQVRLLEKTRADVRTPSFEVVRLRVSPPHIWPNGLQSPERETMPRSEEWGAHGWSYCTRSDAEQKYASLI